MDPAPDCKPRLIMGPLIATLLLGGYFAADSVGALGPLLISELGLSRADLGLLAGVYSGPNIVMVLFGGLLTDRIGTRRASLLYSSMIVAGTALVALSPSLRGLYGGRAVLYGMVLGRTLLGLGAESLAVCQNAMITRWFRGHQLALAFALTLTLARVGSLLSYAAEADIAARFGGLQAALWAPFFACLFSALCNIAYVVLDRRRPDVAPPPVAPAESESESARWLSRLAGSLRFGRKYYLLTAFCVCFYAAFFPFMALASDFLGEKWQLPANTAGRLCSLVTLMTVVLSPLCGGFLDRGDRQKRSDRLLLLAAALLLPAYLLLGLSTLPPLPSFVLLGLAFSLAPAALWPQIGHLVPEHRVATAYGLMTMVQSVALALVPWGSGALRDRTASYTASMLLFAGLGALSIVFALFLMRRVSPRV
jgi:MFS family permease